MSFVPPQDDQQITPSRVAMIPETYELVRSLRSDLCPICGGWKRTAQTMCPKDYRKLSAAQQRNLYQRIGEGYEDAIREAMVSLGVTEFKLPPQASAG